MLKVCKFGGSSLADAEGFLRVKTIVENDPARRVIVVSACGRRHEHDRKVTDLLYLCHAQLAYGASCFDAFEKVRRRYLQIRDELHLTCSPEREFQALYQSLSPETPADLLASRGEYFAARLMAELLGFEFVDAADWLFFDEDGSVKKEESYKKLRQLAQGKSVVIPGFYGTAPDGSIRTFSRGGSDVTGALAAAALNCDVYENWTDVDGVLMADPHIVANAASVPGLSYAQLKLLSDMGTQVMHRCAIEPVWEKQIPMQIKNTFFPNHAGSVVGEKTDPNRKIVAFCTQVRETGGTLAVLYNGQTIPETVWMIAQSLQITGISAQDGCVFFQMDAAKTNEALKRAYTLAENEIFLHKNT